MMKQSRLFATSICLLCILGLVALPVSAGLKDVLQSDEFEGSKLSDIWSIGKDKSSNEKICYINTDIILFKNFTEKLYQIHFEEYFFAP